MPLNTGDIRYVVDRGLSIREPRSETAVAGSLEEWKIVSCPSRVSVVSVSLARLRRYVPIVVPILVSGRRRADQLAVALESRGFGNGAHRTILSEYPVTWRDFVLLTGVVLVGVASAWCYYAGA